MWVVPGATIRAIRNKSHGVRDKTLGLIVHVQAGNGELTGWYDNPGSQASSAWQVMKTGRVFQFGDPDADKFWTQAAGNPDYGAAEGEGSPSEPMTPEQIEGFAQIYAKGHVEEGWPFQLAEKPGDRGLGWHGMGGKAWGNHPNCPGTIRKNQRPAILARAQQIVNGTTTQEDDMFDEKVYGPRIDNASVMAQAASVRTQRIEAALRALAGSLPDAVAKAVTDALDASYDAKVELTPKEN